eukprot:augustus_masked-scaffold_41-processed-gene-0.41-mRNA-1 protein AED:0.08 eAED:1.00 QI:0/-1/0/1/-1/1/1/0/362
MSKNVFTLEELFADPVDEQQQFYDEYEQYKRERDANQDDIFKSIVFFPQMVLDCIKFIRTENGLFDKGIFRQNGDSNVIEVIKNLYSKFKDTEKAIHNSENVNQDFLSYAASQVNKELTSYDVASALKLYFRLLKDPLIPFDLYREMKRIFQKAGNQQDLTERQKNRLKRSQAKELKAIILRMPSPNKELLAFTMSFFQEVVSHQEINKMDAENMGKCLSMSITRIEPSALEDTNPNKIMIAAVEVGLSVKILHTMIQEISFEGILSKDLLQQYHQNAQYTPRRRGMELGTGNSTPNIAPTLRTFGTTRGMSSNKKKVFVNREESFDSFSTSPTAQGSAPPPVPKRKDRATGTVRAPPGLDY